MALEKGDLGGEASRNAFRFSLEFLLGAFEGFGETKDFGEEDDLGELGFGEWSDFEAAAGAGDLSTAGVFSSDLRIGVPPGERTIYAEVHG